MSCNTKTSLAAVIDAVNAQLNNNYVDRDDPRINQGVFTEPTIRGGLMLDEAAKLDFCGYVTECGQREPFGKQWVDRPLYPHNTLVSYEDEGEIKSRWQDIDDVVAGTEIGESYTTYEETRSLGLQGYTIIDSFELGATITQRDQALHHDATGKLYRWAGDLPKTVPAGSTPANSGGVGTNAWLDVSDTALRQEILTGGLLTDTVVTVTARSEGQIERTQSSKNADTVNARDFGASPDKTDNSTSISKAALVAASTGSTLTISEMYPCTSSVSIPANVHVIGSSYDTCGITNNTTTTILIAGGGVVFQGIAILNGSTSRRSVTCEDFNAPVFKSCNINGRIYCRNSTLLQLKAPQFIECNIDCDFGSDYDGVQQYDVFSIYGFGYPVWHNCDIKVANVHRIWKFSQGHGEPIDTGVVGNTNVKMAVINNCRISGHGGKQGIDSYYGTQSIIFTNNHLDISGQTGLAGNKFTNFIEGKTATSYNGVKGQGINVLVQGNTGRLACDFVSIQGSYGLIKDGHIANRYDTVKILNNTLERTGTSPDAFVSVRLCHSVYSDGNTYNVLCEKNRPSVDYSSNKTLTVGNSDVYEGGYLRLFKAVNNSGGDSFSGIADTINIGSISILDFDATAAIQLGALACRTLKIGAVNAVTVDSPVELCRAIRAINTEYIGTFDVSGFEILHKSGGTVSPVLDTAAANNLTVTNCSWLPRFRGYVTGLPTTGTYQRGDTLKRQNPSAGSASSWTCTVGNDTGGLWRMDGQTVNKSSTASRPTLTTSDIGYMHLDTTLATAGKPIWWTGAQWVDATGAET